jgi:hypothetical protein
MLSRSDCGALVDVDPGILLYFSNTPIDPMGELHEVDGLPEGVQNL